MILLITGGCGFIGSNFIHYILKKDPHCRVFNFDKLTSSGNLGNLENMEGMYAGRYTFVHGDICDDKLLAALCRDIDFDVIVNFAVEHHLEASLSDSAPFISTNIMGVQKLLVQARRLGIERFLHCSTGKIYGEPEPNELGFAENAPLAPASLYAASRAGAELLLRAFYESHGLNLLVARCLNCYGPYQFPDQFIPRLLSRLPGQAPAPLSEDEARLRNWLHVEDFCEGIFLALTWGRIGTSYNFGSRSSLSGYEVQNAVLRLLGKPVEPVRPVSGKHAVLDFSLAERELGYAPRYDFERGLAETLDWYQQNQAWCKSVRSGMYLDSMRQYYPERF